MYLVQKYIPAIKSIYQGITKWIGCDPLLSSEAPSGASSELTEQYLITLDEFLKKAADDAGTQLIIFYHPRHSIGNDGNIIDNTDSDYKHEFANACEVNGIVFVDLTEKFEELYEEECILTHGFINTSIGTGHLNKYGHQAISEVITGIIEAFEKEIQ